MSVDIRCGDVLDELADLPDESAQCVVTSPPYFMDQFSIIVSPDVSERICRASATEESKASSSSSRFEASKGV